jgi:hypothetical protein
MVSLDSKMSSYGHIMAFSIIMVLGSAFRIMAAAMDYLGVRTKKRLVAPLLYQRPDLQASKKYQIPGGRPKNVRCPSKNARRPSKKCKLAEKKCKVLDPKMRDASALREPEAVRPEAHPH